MRAVFLVLASGFEGNSMVYRSREGDGNHQYILLKKAEDNPRAS
jgi:hypothetical protein